MTTRVFLVRHGETTLSAEDRFAGSTNVPLGPNGGLQAERLARRVGRAGRRPRAQHAFVQRLSELGIAYRGSPIVEGAGKRSFDESLRGGDGIRSRFLLVVDDDVAPPINEAAKELAGSSHDIVERRSQPRHDITLVRPDGYIAYSAHNHDGIAALESVRTVLERQTRSEFDSSPTSGSTTSQAWT